MSALRTAAVVIASSNTPMKVMSRSRLAVTAPAAGHAKANDERLRRTQASVKLLLRF